MAEVNTLLANPINMPKPTGFANIVSQQGMYNQGVLQQNKGELVEADSGLKSVESDLTAAMSKLSGLKATLKTKTQELSNLQSTLSSKTSEISGLETDITNKRTSLSTLQTTLNSIPVPTVKQEVPAPAVGQVAPIQMPVVETQTDWAALRRQQAAEDFYTAAKRNPKFVEFGTGVKLRGDGMRVMVDETGSRWYQVDANNQIVPGGERGYTAPAHGAMIDSQWSPEVLSQLGMVRNI